MVRITDAQVEDIIEWDVVNWSRALKFWSEKSNFGSSPLTCLELGGRRGGLSLWMALQGHTVICSDLNDPEKDAFPLHTKHGVTDLISYADIDATKIPFQDTFDVVLFKSILGGISRNGNDMMKQKTIDSIYKSLKPGGILLFAENLEASGLHKALRKRFVAWGDQWNYLKYADIDPLFRQFQQVDHRSTGFFGAFGRTEGLRRFFGWFDGFFVPFIPQSKRYIAYGVARKAK